ncbi:MAG: hypothetical protein CM15mP125_3110 [Gammaproteobacteria bacterium]|nr:MAG: hypothetical protein CM15mP125_3110 [Gammaproteobacteria bacterium]
MQTLETLKSVKKPTSQSWTLNRRPLMSYRMQNCKSLEERLAVIVLLGDDRAISATYASGHCVHYRDIGEES